MKSFNLQSEATMKVKRNRKIIAQSSEDITEISDPQQARLPRSVDPNSDTMVQQFQSSDPHSDTKVQTFQPPLSGSDDQYGQYEDHTAELMKAITTNPEWSQLIVEGLDIDVIEMVKSATQPLWEGMHLNPDLIDWNSMADEVLNLAGVSGFDTSGVSVTDFPEKEEVAATSVQQAVARKASFIAAEYLLGRRMLGRRRAAISPAHDLHEWAIRLAATADTFTKSEFAYYAQILKEAKIAMDSGDAEVSAELVKYVRRAFELGAANWDPSLFQEEPQLQQVADPQQQSNEYWGEAGVAPQQMLDPNMFDPMTLAPQPQTPQQQMSEDEFNQINRGPASEGITLGDDAIDPAVLSGDPGAQPGEEDWGQFLGDPMSDTDPIKFKAMVAALKIAVKQAAEDRDLVKFTPPNYDLVLGDMVKAEKDGYDTFPRPYIHVFKNYIMSRVSTASENAWLPHLVNDGFVINRMDTNRGRGVKASK